MLEHEVMYRASGQGHVIDAQKIVLMSSDNNYAVQLFELFSRANFDICYTKSIDETLISSTKPLFIVYYFNLSNSELTSYQRSQIFLQQITRLQAFNTPIILLLEDSLYLSLAPIDLPNVSPIIWPTSGEQLIDQINTVVENHSRYAIYDDSVVFKDLVIDTDRMLVKQNNNRIDITKTEYDLLMFFIESKGIVQSREVILDKVWNLKLFEGSNIVDVHIKSLRKKLNDSAVDPKYIITVRGVGYRLADI